MKQLLSLLLIVLTVTGFTSCVSDKTDEGKENNTINSSATSSDATSTPYLHKIKPPTADAPSETTSSPNLHKEESPESDPSSDAPKTNLASQDSVDENSESYPKSNNDEPYYGGSNDNQLAVDIEREILDENDYRPDPDAPEPDIYGGEAIELQG